MVTFWGKLSLFWERNLGKGQTNVSPANWALDKLCSGKFCPWKFGCRQIGPLVLIHFIYWYWIYLYILYIGIGHAMPGFWDLMVGSFSATLPLPFSSGMHSTSGFPRWFGGQEHSSLCLVLLHRALVPQVPPRWNFPSWSTTQSWPQEPSWQFSSSVQSSSLLQPGRHWPPCWRQGQWHISPSLQSVLLLHPCSSGREFW